MPGMNNEHLVMLLCLHSGGSLLIVFLKYTVRSLLLKTCALITGGPAQEMDDLQNNRQGIEKNNNVS